MKTNRVTARTVPGGLNKMTINNFDKDKERILLGYINISAYDCKNPSMLDVEYVSKNFVQSDDIFIFFHENHNKTIVGGHRSRFIDLTFMLNKEENLEGLIYTRMQEIIIVTIRNIYKKRSVRKTGFNIFFGYSCKYWDAYISSILAY